MAYDKIGGNYALSANSTKICLLGVILHAEFISAMENSSKSYDFNEKWKKK